MHSVDARDLQQHLRPTRMCMCMRTHMYMRTQMRMCARVRREFLRRMFKARHTCFYWSELAGRRACADNGWMRRADMDSFERDMLA